VDRSNKEKLVAALNASLSDTVCFVITHQRGMTVAEVTNLAGSDARRSASFKVTKNRLPVRPERHEVRATFGVVHRPDGNCLSRDPVAAAKWPSSSPVRRQAGHRRGSPRSQQLDARGFQPSRHAIAR